MTTKKMIQKSSMGLALSALTLMPFTSCSDDNDPITIYPELPADGADNIKSIEHKGAIANTTYDWKMSYYDNRLTNAKGTIREPEDDKDKKFSYTSEITYGHDFINVVNSHQEKVKIVLNRANYIEKMTVNENTYEFHYADDHLSRWEKTITENSFGHASIHKSYGVIEYLNGDLKSIKTSTNINDEVVTTTFTSSDLVNHNGLLPEMVSAQLGCIGFEHLYYAGLLGKPTVHLVKAIKVDHSKDSSKNYSIDFHYSLNSDKNVELCSYTTPEGKPASVIYNY